MDTFESDDEDRPIESYPGYIGMTMDHDFFPGDELSDLSEIDWNSYLRLLEFAADDHALTVAFKTGVRQIRVIDGDSIATILDQVPSIHVSNAPDGKGLASAAIYVFFIADDVSMEDLDHDVRTLKEVVESDLADLQRLSAEHGHKM